MWKNWKLLKNIKKKMKIIHSVTNPEKTTVTTANILVDFLKLFFLWCAQNVCIYLIHIIYIYMQCIIVYRSYCIYNYASFFFHPILFHEHFTY